MRLGSRQQVAATIEVQTGSIRNLLRPASRVSRNIASSVSQLHVVHVRDWGHCLRGSRVLRALLAALPGCCSHEVWMEKELVSFEIREGEQAEPAEQQTQPLHITRTADGSA